MMQFEQDRRSRAEQFILAALLRDAGAIRHCQQLKPADFSHDTHGQIFRAMLTLIDRGEPVTDDRVYEVIYRTRMLHKVGLMAYLHALKTVRADPASTGYYVSIMTGNAPPPWSKQCRWDGAIHTINDPGHSHSIRDPGHTHGSMKV
jgi:replicative DNA helicase